MARSTVKSGPQSRTTCSPKATLTCPYTHTHTRTGVLRLVEAAGVPRVICGEPFSCCHGGDSLTSYSTSCQNKRESRKAEVGLRYGAATSPGRAELALGRNRQEVTSWAEDARFPSFRVV